MPGTLHLLGMGPGDPDLVTVKAARLLEKAAVVASFAGPGKPGRARETAGPMINGDAVDLRFEYPMTTERHPDHPDYIAVMTAFYDECAMRLANYLVQTDAVLLCEGDPLFYGSAMYILDRLRHRFLVASVPGVLGMTGCWNAALLPITHGNDALAVLPGTMPEDELTRHLAATDAAVIMKLGRNLPKVRLALQRAGMLERAIYVEHGATERQRVVPLRLGPVAAPYFSLVLVPGRQNRR